MIVKSLQKMEAIVKNNKFLSWDGWTVIENRLNMNGAVHPNGAYVKGRWIVQKRYDPSEIGWDIPDKLVR